MQNVSMRELFAWSSKLGYKLVRRGHNNFNLTTPSGNLIGASLYTVRSIIVADYQSFLTEVGV